jgi:hypothetical protein
MEVAQGASASYLLPQLRKNTSFVEGRHGWALLKSHSEPKDITGYPTLDELIAGRRNPAGD